MTAVNETLKKECDNDTIGLLLCKEKNRLTVDWSLRGMNVPMGVTSYELNRFIPENILEKLPSEDDINRHLDIN